MRNLVEGHERIEVARLCARGGALAALLVLAVLLGGGEVRAAEGQTESLDSLGALTTGVPSPKLAGWALSKHALLTLKGVQQSGPSGKPRPVVVSFFATWCEPCREGLPRLQTLADRSNGAFGLLLVAVGEEGAAVEAMLSDLQVTAPAVGDRYLTISTRWGVAGVAGPATLPKTVVIGADSKVAAIFGREGKDFEDRLRQALRGGE